MTSYNMIKKTLMANDGTDLAHYAKSGLEIVGMEQ